MLGRPVKKFSIRQYSACPKPSIVRLANDDHVHGAAWRGFDRRVLFFSESTGRT